MKFSSVFAPFQPMKKLAVKRPFTTFISGAILLLAFFFIRQAMMPKIEDTTSSKVSAPKEVSVFEIGKDTPTGTVIGTLDRENLSTIYATASGIIDDLSVREGSLVTQGSSIAHIAPSSASTGRMLAESDLASVKDTRSTEQRILDLNKKISESETTSGRKEDLAKATKKIGSENLDQRLLSAKLNADIARSNEQVFTPFAPFSGRIEAIFVSKGDLVAPGTPIASIAGNAKRSILRAEIPASLALLVDPKGNHRVTLPSGETTSITLAHISANPTTADSFQATFILPDTEARFLGDTTLLTITLALRNTADTIFIPLSATNIDRDSASVLIDRNGTAEYAPVTLGQSRGTFIEVTSGLSLGDRIILDHSVRPGNKITIQK